MKIALLGDIALFGNLSINNNTEVIEYFKDIAAYLSTFDLVVGNLESPFSVKKKTYGAKSAFLCSDPDNIAILRSLHVQIVNIANNHMFDYGKEGLDLTKKLLKDNGIEYFGVDGKEVIVEVNDTRLAFAGFCCYSSGPNGCVKYGEPGVNEYNLENAASIIEKNHSLGYLSIISVHAGIEHVNFPSVETIRAARFLAGKAPIVYYGHHPHVVQGVEEYKDSLIAYSLGNFCFDDIYTKASGNKPLIALTENNRHGAILELDIEGNKVTNWSERIIYNGKGKRMELVEAYEPIKEYNSAVINCELDIESYNAKRQSLLNTRALERKASRNLTWYFRRLRPRYLRVLINSKKRAKKYNNNVLKYLSEFPK